MNLKFPRSRKILFTVTALFLVLLAGICAGFLGRHVFSEDGRFEAFTEKLFKKEVSGSTLTLHYSLADPSSRGITHTEPSLGTVTADREDTYRLYEEYEKILKNFSSSGLSRENQITLDHLLLYFHTQQEQKGHELLEEMLGPSLGIQAQLPVLLAEYAFHEDQDIVDYLKLLSSIRPYFQSILAFEQEKSKAGFFMSDTTLDRILKQCNSFIQDPESNYMLEVFSEKLKEYGKFSEEEQAALNNRHRKILLQQVIPAYQELTEGLSALRGTGKSSCGLCHFDGGKEYYRYLLMSQTGTYDSIETIEQRLSGQLAKDMKQVALMLKEQPSLVSRLFSGKDLPEFEPEDAMKTLQQKMKEDFPALDDVTYEIRYVHQSMENYLSPAFYLTPPLDTGNPNIIYLNGSSHSSNLNLFTTLAHEGFPGHLYQTVFFNRQNPDDIRCLFTYDGYTEGWATYVESYAFRYAASFLDDPAASDLTRLAWLNRSITLCIYSLTDIGIHYRGWSQEKTARFLKAFGFRDQKVTNEIFQYIVETPGNYLKYYLGYLNLADLREQCAGFCGDSFQIKDFHKKILEIGPVSFPVLRKYILADYTISDSSSVTLKKETSSAGVSCKIYAFS